MNDTQAELGRCTEQQAHDTLRLQSIGQLAGGVAHHFNNILTAVRGYTELARNGLPLEHPSRSDLDEACAAVDRAAALTRQLVAFSRRQALRPELLQVAATLREMEVALRRLVCEQIELTIHVDDGVCDVSVDKSQIEQAMLNLVANACEAMPDGGTLRIRAENHVVAGSHSDDDGVAPAGRYALIAVKDDGCGMTPEVLARAFEPFFTTKSVGQGTGLGLSTVHGFVRQSGGYIQIESVESRGTRVEILLPSA
jgi:signal transduction histidine kinase